MVLVKGPLELAIKTRREPLSKNSAGCGCDGSGSTCDMSDTTHTKEPQCVAGENEEVEGGGAGGFIAAKSFGGSRAGYVFKAGARGQGYYADVETAGSPPSSSPAL